MYIAYIEDRAAWERANREGRNFWDAYWPEVLDRMGLGAAPLPPESLRDAGALKETAALMIGKLSEGAVDDRAVRVLSEWVENGGLLVGSAVEGLDALFGVKGSGIYPQAGDDFAPAAALDFRSHPLTEGLRWPLRPEQGPVAASDIRIIEPDGSEALADMKAFDGRSLGAGVTARPSGKGWAFYFPFELPKTFWAIQQGRPVTGDRDGDGFLRVGDSIALEGFPWDVPYTDLLLWLLRNMIASASCPFLATLPPASGQVSDALFFWGGDDEAATDGLQVFASDWMKAHGLPYHINAMPVEGKFGLTAKEFRHIEANGHEISLHYNHISNRQHPYAFSREDILEQMDAYLKTFGKPPVCSVNHYCTWTGWAEPARWMLEAGGQGDNSRIHWGSPPVNPINRYGFAMGTSIPHRAYEDAEHGNRPLDFIFQPINAYEVGYEQDRDDFEQLRRVIDLSARYHLTTNMFYHPVYITHYPACRRAIEEFIRYSAERGVRAVHMGNDAFCLWWKARSRSALRVVTAGPEETVIEADIRCPEGAMMQLPLGKGPDRQAFCDGSPAASELREEFGNRWLWVVIPFGKHRIEVR
ncbi:MAG: hypothetical protein IT210_11465 [Armatimonadetes bacterium]|nr:hypothetical protein [Armatimonadota bacterium]